MFLTSSMSLTLSTWGEYSLVNEELFDQLLYQAGLTAQGCWEELDLYTKQAIERFLYLAVCECAWAAENLEQQAGGDQQYGRVIAALKIRKHFEVSQ